MHLSEIANLTDALIWEMYMCLTIREQYTYVLICNEAPGGVCAPLIPENNALISPSPCK